MPDRRATWFLIVLAIALRAAAILVLQSHTVPRSTYEHGEIAENLLSGRGFSVKFLGADGPTSQQAPIYPAILAVAYAVGGIESPRALFLLQMAQAILGGVLVAGVLAMVREIAPDRRWFAILAGLISAVHPTLVYAATHVQVVALATTLLVWTLALAYRVGRTGRAGDAVAAGLALGLLVLTDPILGLVTPGAVWAVAMGQGGRKAIRPAAIAALTAFFCVTPWIVRNATIHGEFVFIKSSFGYAFWQGNCALSEGTDKVVRASVEKKLTPRGSGLQAANRALWEARHEAGYLDDIALTKADYHELSRLSEPARSRLLFRRALDDLRADPWRYPTLCLRRLRYFILFDETNPKTRSLIYRVAHIGLTIAAVIGLILTTPSLRRRMGPTLLTAGLIALFHAMTIVSARFHVPIEPLMGLWAASAVGRLGPPDSRISCPIGPPD
ncbi:MAG: hypothetical protein JWN86_4074 [Planctomycetota bacterium]|nr:hypothetical protein [Planctomycetota bacterium]